MSSRSLKSACSSGMKASKGLLSNLIPAKEALPGGDWSAVAAVGSWGVGMTTGFTSSSFSSLFLPSIAVQTRSINASFSCIHEGTQTLMTRFQPNPRRTDFGSTSRWYAEPRAAQFGPSSMTATSQISESGRPTAMSTLSEDRPIWVWTR